jgi:hypothetical protein
MISERLLGILLVRLVLLTAIFLVAGGCRRNQAPSYFSVPGTNLEIPRQPGWVVDNAASSSDAATSGIVLRLLRNHGITGSPRVDVVLESPKSSPVQIDDFLERNLREIKTLERSGGIHIERIDKQAVNVAKRRGYRVRHEYVSGDIAITQLSLFLVLAGRGVAVTAVGRTELYTPFARDIDALLAGIRIKEPTIAASPKPEVLKPIDLGKLGGANN